MPAAGIAIGAMIRRRHLLIGFAFIIFQGCVAYHQEPLDHSRVSRELTPPSMETIRIQAREIKHPILQRIEFDEKDGLSPDEAAVMAVLVNPTLRAIRDERGIAKAQLLQAAILPNPQLSYSLDVPTGGSTQGTVNGFGLGLGWDIRSLITRHAEIDAARAQAASVDLDIAWQEWQVAEAAKLHVCRSILLQQQLAIAGSEQEGLSESLDALRKAVDAGYVTVIDLSATHAAQQNAHASLLAIQQQAEQERLALNEALGLPPEYIIPLQQGVEPLSQKVLPATSEIMDGIEGRRLDLLALKMGYQSQEARLRSAILAQFPNINIGFSHARDTGNVVSTGFGITIDLPIFDRNQGPIAIEKATRKQLLDEYVARVYQARSDLAKILANIDAIKQQIHADEQIIPTLSDVVQAYHNALLEGNADVLSYYNVRNELFEKQIGVLKLKQDLADQTSALEIAAGWYCTRAEEQEIPK